jgi:hypothetical protein
MTDRQIIDYAVKALEQQLIAQDAAFQKQINSLIYAQGQLLTELSNIKQTCPLHELRIRRLEDQGEKWEETTGQHHIIQVQRLHESAQWWKRWAATGIITILAGAIGAIATVMLQGCVL